jgi:CBS domain-containing protein
MAATVAPAFAPDANGAPLAGKRKAEEDIGNGAKKHKVDEHSTDSSFIVQLTQIPAMRLAAAKPGNKVFVCERTDKVTDVFKGMVKHNFLSVPVLQKTGHKYYGFVDVMDIVKYCVDNFEGTVDMTTQVMEAEKFRDLTVNDIMKYPLTRRNPFHPFGTSYSLFSVIEALAKENNLHRVPLINENRELKNILTQSQVTAFLHQNIALLGGKAKKPIGSITGCMHKVHSVDEDETAMHAFEVMLKENISGVAVTKADGHLMGNLSLRDLKTIMTDASMFWRLQQKASNFIRHLRELVKTDEVKQNRPRTSVVAHADETLESVVQKITEHGLHRVFIVDAEKKPVGCISLKDILLEIITPH